MSTSLSSLNLVAGVMPTEALRPECFNAYGGEVLPGLVSPNESGLCALLPGEKPGEFRTDSGRRIVAVPGGWRLVHPYGGQKPSNFASAWAKYAQYWADKRGESLAPATGAASSQQELEASAGLEILGLARLRAPSWADDAEPSAEALIEAYKTLVAGGPYWNAQLSPAEGRRGLELLGVEPEGRHRALWLRMVVAAAV